MTPKTINTFISSANRDVNEPIYNFSVDFTDDVIKCNQDQYIRINVISFDMLNTMYNIKNAILSFHVIGSPEDVCICDIPTGNYSVYSLKKWFEEDAYWFFAVDTETKYKFSSYFKISYNVATNTFTIKTQPSSENVMLTCSVLGFAEPTEINVNGATGEYINLTNYNKVILRTDSLSFDISCIENIKYTNVSNKLKFSNILFWSTKVDVEPFRNITYTNNDGGNSFNMLIHDKAVNQMNLQLTNELGEFITDAPDYLLVLQFTIYDKDDWFKKTILEISNHIKQIFIMMLWIMENYLKII